MNDVVTVGVTNRFLEIGLQSHSTIQTLTRVVGVLAEVRLVMDISRTLLLFTPLGDDGFLLTAPSVATEKLLQLPLVLQRIWQPPEDVIETRGHLEDARHRKGIFNLIYLPSPTRSR